MFLHSYFLGVLHLRSRFLGLGSSLIGSNMFLLCNILRMLSCLLLLRNASCRLHLDIRNLRLGHDLPTAVRYEFLRFPFRTSSHSSSNLLENSGGDADSVRVVDTAPLA